VAARLMGTVRPHINASFLHQRIVAIAFCTTIALSLSISIDHSGAHHRMNSTEGVNWVISWTPNFEQTVTFFRDVLGLPITAEGVPVTATQFARYAPFTLLIGGVLESVEPTADVRQRYTAPIVSFTVDDVAQARQQLEERQVIFVAPIVRTSDGWGWTYFRAPDGNGYQLQGRYACRSRCTDDRSRLWALASACRDTPGHGYGRNGVRIDYLKRQDGHVE